MRHRVRPSPPRPVANRVSSAFALEGATGQDAARAPTGRRAEVAQLVEHGSEKPGVPSSILGLGTTLSNDDAPRLGVPTPQLSQNPGAPHCPERAPTTLFV